MKRIAVIRIRGSKGVRREIKDTMSFLRLNNKNHCVIIDNKPTHVGMLRKIKKYSSDGERMVSKHSSLVFIKIHPTQSQRSIMSYSSTLLIS